MQAAYFVLLLPLLSSLAVKGDSGEVAIQATNRTQTPGIHYIIDAVECLKEAYSVYPDEVQRAEAYSELFQERHPEYNWDVVVGYTAVYINSDYFIEASVTGGSKKDLRKDSKDKGVLYMIFSVPLTNVTPST